jgi:predicted nucleic acid-binding protein
VSVFADASALVKLYADESGHAVIRRVDALAISQISRVEVPAALWRKQRLGELVQSDAAVLVAAFEADYFGTASDPPRFTVAATTASVLDDAARLTGVHGLRAYDAVQLATALAVRQADAECATFAAFDETLRDAAAGEGWQLLSLTR